MAEQKEPAPQIDLFRAEVAAKPSLPLWIAEEQVTTLHPFGGIPGAKPLYGLSVIALDFETTGLAVERGDAVCEIGLVASAGGDTKVLMSTFVNPDRPLSAATRRITGIDDCDLAGAPRFSELLPTMLDLIGSTPLVMHNAPFDLQLLLGALAGAGLPLVTNLAMDTLLITRFLGRTREGNSLRHAAEYYGIPSGRIHRAADDARATALVYHAVVPYLELRGVRTVGDLVRGRMAGSAQLFALRPSSTAIDLATRAAETGRVVTVVYAPKLGAKAMVRRIRARAFEGERYLIGWDLDIDAERTFRLDRIMRLDDGRESYVSPWASSDETQTSSQAEE